MNAKSNPGRRRLMGRALGLASVLALVGCSANASQDQKEAPKAEEAHVSASKSAVKVSDLRFFIPPVVQLLNDNFGAQDYQFGSGFPQTGFSVFWFLQPTSDTHTPSLTVPYTNAQVSCTSDGITYITGTTTASCTLSANVNTYCFCTVTALPAGQSYVYTVNLPGSTSFNGTAKTAPLRGATTPFSFVFYSDTHGELGDDAVHHAYTMGAIRHFESPDFLLFGGDMGTFGGTAKLNPEVDGVGLGGGYQSMIGYNSFANTSGTQDGSNFTREWLNSLFLDQSRGQAPLGFSSFPNDPPLYSNIPVAFGVGNHDWWNTCDEADCSFDPYEHGGTMPEFLKVTQGDFAFQPDLLGANRPGDSADNYHFHGWRGRYYSFDYGNSRFIVLDTGLHNRMDIGGDWVTASGGCGGQCNLMYDTPQMKFLVKALEDAKAHPEIKHKFIVMHTSPYDQKGDMDELIDNEDYASDDNDTFFGNPPSKEKYRKGFISRVAAKYHVDAVLSGHVHDYQRRTKDGTKYITCSGAGGFDMSTTPGVGKSSVPYDCLNDNCANGPAALLGGGYCVVNVNGDGVTYTRKNTYTVSPTNCLGKPITLDGITQYTDCDGPTMHNPPLVMDTTQVGALGVASLQVVVANPNVQVSWHNANSGASTYSIHKYIDGAYAGTIGPLSQSQLGGTAADPVWTDTLVTANHRYGYSIQTTVGTALSGWSETKSINFPVCPYATHTAAYSFNTYTQGIHVIAGSAYSCPGVSLLGYRLERQERSYLDPDGLETEWERVGTCASDPISGGCDDLTPSFSYSGARYRIVAQVTSSGGSSDIYAPASNWADTTGAPYRATQVTARRVSSTQALIEWELPAAAQSYVSIEKSACSTGAWTVEVPATAMSAWVSNTNTQSAGVSTSDACTAPCTDAYRVGLKTNPNAPTYYSEVVSVPPGGCQGTPNISGKSGPHGESIDITVDSFSVASGGVAPDSYSFYRRPSGGTDWELLRTVMSGTLPLTYRDGDAHAYGSYDYSVVGHNAAQVGGPVKGLESQPAVLTGLVRQPGNCATPFVLPMGVSPAGSTVQNIGNASMTDTRSLCAGGSGGKILFYEFTLSATENVYFDTFGTPFDTVLGVLSGSSACDGTPGMCNDDAHCSPTPEAPTASYNSRLSVTLAAGTYYLYVKAYSTGVTDGSLTLNWSHSGSAYANPILIGSNTLYSGTTLGGTSHSNSTCGGQSGAPDMVYGFMVCPGSRTVSASTCYSGTNVDTVAYLRQNASAPDLACNDDTTCSVGNPANRQSTVSTTAPVLGGIYYLVVDTYSTSGGAFKFQASF